MDGDKNSTRIRFFAALAGGVLAAAALLCAFFTPLGIYSLIASVLLELGSVALAHAQKRKNDFAGVKVLTIILYVLLGISAAVFVGGLIYAAAA